MLLIEIKPLSAELQRAANFTDGQVSPGQTYCYAISAVDGNGNESARSEAVSITVPETAAVP